MKSTVRFLATLALGLAIGSSALAAKYVISDDDAAVIEGDVQKPDVTVVISRENLNKAYELDLKESFIDKIIESVEHDPF
ncbi:MAG: hypothetical protein H6734_19900 [Alphaproteobacteria bacterium]|nr:hypothetical protein [Alphaproteobacteria bacterium]